MKRHQPLESQQYESWKNVGYRVDTRQSSAQVLYNILTLLPSAECRPQPTRMRMESRQNVGYRADTLHSSAQVLYIALNPTYKDANGFPAKCWVSG
jgi:hypothetical protein